MDKVKIFFQKVLEKLKKILRTVVVFIKKNKVLSVTVAVLLVALILVFFLIIRPKWDKSHQNPDNGYTQSESGKSEKEYTQSEIDEIAKWWENYDGIQIEGNLPMGQ